MPEQITFLITIETTDLTPEEASAILAETANPEATLPAWKEQATDDTYGKRPYAERFSK